MKECYDSKKNSTPCYNCGGLIYKVDGEDFKQCILCQMKYDYSSQDEELYKVQKKEERISALQSM